MIKYNNLWVCRFLKYYFQMPIKKYYIITSQQLTSVGQFLLKKEPEF